MRKPFLAAAAAIFVGALSGAGHAAPMRWHYDIENLGARSSTIWEPEPRVYTLDARGYFDADDRDADGVIVKSEVLDLQPLLGVIYTEPLYPSDLSAFTYDPLAGLTYTVSGYRYDMVFGVAGGRYSDVAWTVYQWTQETRTRITGPSPIPVPEPGGVALALGGVIVVARVVNRRRVSG